MSKSDAKHYAYKFHSVMLQVMAAATRLPRTVRRVVPMVEVSWEALRAGAKEGQAKFAV